MRPCRKARLAADARLERIERLDYVVFAQRLIEARAVHEESRERAAHRRVAWRSGEGELEQPSGTGPVELRHVREPGENRIRRSGVGVELDGALRSLFRRAWIALRDVEDELAPMDISAGEFRPRGTEAGIGADRCFQVLDRLWQ